MNRTPIIIAIILSIIAHIVVGETAMQFKGDPPGKRRVTVAVIGAEKKKDEPKPLPPPPPPPVEAKVAKVAPAKVLAPPPTAVEPVHEAAPAPAAPSGLEFSNATGAGVDVGGPTVKRPTGDPKDVARPQAVKKPQAVVKPTGPAGGNDAGDGPAPCTEEPIKPEAIAKTEIEYTEEARASGVEGRLVLNISIDANGAVTNVAVASSVDPALDAAAIAAVKQWRFKPSTRCGKPVAGSYKLARRFELGD